MTPYGGGGSHLKIRSLERFPDPNAVKNLVFLAQRLDELTFDYSIDSYKAPTTNCPALIDEIYQILSRSEGVDHDTQMARCRPIAFELAQRLSNNPIVSRIIDSDRNISERVKVEDFHQFREIIYLLREELSEKGYITTCMDLLIEECDGGSKKKINFLAMELVASLENHGMSRAHLHFATRHEFFDAGEDVEDYSYTRKFLTRIFPEAHQFIIAFKVKNFTKNIEASSFNSFGITLSENLPEPFANADAAENFQKKKAIEQFFIVENIRALDRFSAIQTALRRASLVQNLFRVYHHKNDFGISDEALVNQCCVEGVRLTKCDVVRMQNVADDRPKKAAQRLGRLLGQTRLFGGPDRARLVSVAEFHGMGLDSGSVENQILNIWIAMETISPSKENRTKIDNVLSAFVPSIGLQYVPRLLDQALFDLSQVDRTGCKRIINKVAAVPGEPFEIRFLKFLSDGDYESLRNDLYAHLGNHELLRFRIFSLSQLFANPQKCLQAIDRHLDRVDWQLRRIYRVRNSIVHLGETPSFSVAVADNAHDYLDQVIHLSNELSCGPNGFSTYRSIFQFVDAEFQIYCARLKTARSFGDLATLALWSRRAVPDRGDIKES